ncbi:hypothetical protein TRVA0_032S00804 [Trichomonascus vanleenenianus]|uniref:ubiquitin-specific protease UBP1 n=1 Tax=Trichomonascus vanleenenianus TaxID=2268995 RepID=UPI003ECBAB6C
MFSDTFMGSVDMASAGVRYIYDKAATTLQAEHPAVHDEGISAEQRHSFDQVRRLKVGGLYNEGNTCFMNCVVQSMASLDRLSTHFGSEEFQNFVKSSDRSVSAVLQRLVEKLNVKRASKHTYSTSELIKSLGQGNRWNGYDQEDAQEFFQQLLMGFEKDIKEMHGISDKKPRLITPFDGYSATRVGCLQCGEMEGIRKGVVSSIDLSLGSTSLSSAFSSGSIDLHDLLREYCSMEIISGVECYRCSLIKFREDLAEKASNPDTPAQLKSMFEMRIKQVDTALKESVIDEKKYSELKPSSHKEQCDKSKQTMFALPTSDIIMVHINRSVFDMETGYTRKNFTAVHFPLVLNMSEYVIDPTDETNHDPSKSMHPMHVPEAQAGLHYTLKAVVVHFGSHNFGHYVCFRKCNQGFWWRISDHAVELSYESQVLNAQGVFMLFYEKASKQSPPATAPEEQQPDPEREPTPPPADSEEHSTDLVDMINKASL